MRKIRGLLGIAVAVCVLVGASAVLAAEAPPLRAPGADCEWAEEFGDLIAVLRGQREEIRELHQQIHVANRQLAASLRGLRGTQNYGLMRQIHAQRGEILELRVSQLELIQLRHQALGLLIDGREFEDPDLVRTGLEQVIAVNEDVLELLAGILARVQAMLGMLP